MNKRINDRYSKEFRDEATKLVVEGGVSAYEASRQLALPKSTLENWVRAFRAGKLGNIGGQQRPLTEIGTRSGQARAGPGQARARILKKPSRTLSRSRCTVRDDYRASV